MMLPRTKEKICNNMYTVISIQTEDIKEQFNKIQKRYPTDDELVNLVIYIERKLYDSFKEMTEEYILENIDDQTAEDD